MKRSSVLFTELDRRLSLSNNNRNKRKYKEENKKCRKNRQREKQRDFDKVNNNMRLFDSEKWIIFETWRLTEHERRRFLCTIFFVEALEVLSREAF